jgi:hypothetical protein
LRELFPADVAEMARFSAAEIDAQRFAVDVVVACTDCDRDDRHRLHSPRQLYLDGIKDPKRLTFKGLQALARA